jgi:hypothetical protein
MNWSLTQIPPHVRLIIAIFLVVNATGYLVALALVADNTGLSVGGVADYYAGNEARIDAGEVVHEFKFPPSRKELLGIAHSHIISLSVIFLIVGLIFSATSYSIRLKLLLASELLLAIITTFAGIALTAFVNREFSYLLYLSSALMGFGYFLAVGLILLDIWRLDKRA